MWLRITSAERAPMEAPEDGIRVWHQVAAAFAATLLVVPILSGAAMQLADLDTRSARAAAVDSLRAEHQRDTRQIRREIRDLRFDVRDAQRETNRKLDCLLALQGVEAENRCADLVVP